MRLLLSFFIFSLIYIIPLNIYAQDESEETLLLDNLKHMQEQTPYYDISNSGYWREAARHFPRMLVAPLEWSDEEWLNAATVISIGYGVYLSDEKVRELAQKEGAQEFNEQFTHHVEHLGRGVVVLPSLGLLYAIGNLTENERLKKVSLLGFESATYSTLITMALKRLSGRDRPGEDVSHDGWNFFDSWSVKGSVEKAFPSGHTNLTFSVATVIAEEYQDYQLVPYVVYGLAGATAAQRVLDDKHWASDVFAGAIIGHFTAKTIMGYHQENEKRVQLIPLVENRDNYSLNFAIRF